MSLDLKDFIKRHLEDIKTLEGHEKVDYSSEELHELCKRSIDAYSKEPALIRTSAPCNIIGTLYGSFRDLLDTFNEVDRQNIFIDKYMFLGNYVDRGNRSIETISLLLALKLQDPERYFLLRGNHECAAVNRTGGFFDELVGRFGADEGEKLFNHFNEVFAWMPLAAIIGEKGFCVHGGISPRIRSLDDIEKIARPLRDPLSDPLATDMLWGELNDRLFYYRPNPERHNAVMFGPDNVLNFLLGLHLNLILIGADESIQDGYQLLFKKLIISLYAASGLDGEHNAGCIISCRNGLYYAHTRSVV